MMLSSTERVTFIYTILRVHIKCVKPFGARTVMYIGALVIYGVTAVLRLTATPACSTVGFESDRLYRLARIVALAKHYLGDDQADRVWRSQLTRVFRILRRPYSKKPLDGEGAYRFGGRWSRPGVWIAYTA